MKTERDVDKKGVGKKSSSKQYDLNKKKDIKDSVDKVDDSEEVCFDFLCRVPHSIVKSGYKYLYIQA